MKTIPLTKGDFAIVDDDDYEYLIQFEWFLTPGGYAARKTTKNGRPSIVLMHREIAKTPKGMQTDHINGNRLDNRKCNLRICTNAENSRNRGPMPGTSKYKGVRWLKNDKKWQANIKLNQKQITLGCFNSEIEAAKAYNEAAIKYFGEFAWLNDIEPA